MHRGPAGTIELNKALKAVLNPGDGTVWGFDAGDRVVATANHLELEPTGFANGEVGVVTKTGDGSLDVAFASGPVTVTGRRCRTSGTAGRSPSTARRARSGRAWSSSCRPRRAGCCRGR